MTVLVDTTVWSLAFRRKTASDPRALQLVDLINRDEAVLLGAVRQELLSGVRDAQEFSTIRKRLREFPDLQVHEDHYERAAEFYNICRSSGVQGSNTDFLICAVADLNQVAIFTADRDFQNYTALLPIRLF